MKITLIISILCFQTLVFAAAQNKYPLVITVRGQAWLNSADQKHVMLKNKTLLKGQAEIQTSMGSEVHIKWDEQREMSVLENTRVTIPAIAWETGQAPVLILNSGSIRWQAMVTDGYNVALRSDLFEFIAPPADVVLEYDVSTAKATAWVLKGQMSFGAMNAEVMLPLKEGQKVQFNGVLEDGKVAYDVLLKGLKIPRGKLGVVQTIPDAEKKLFTQVEDRKKEAEAKRKAAEKKLAIKLKQEGFICEKPSGRFDQCAWVCEGLPRSQKKKCDSHLSGVQCVRRRCDANGEWSAPTVIGPEKALELCKPKPVVAQCDY